MPRKTKHERPSFGVWLMSARQRMGMSQKALAARMMELNEGEVGFDYTMLGRLERGVQLDVKNPEILRLIAGALGVPQTEVFRQIGWITEEVEDEPPRFWPWSERGWLDHLLGVLSEEQAARLVNAAEFELRGIDIGVRPAPHRPEDVLDEDDLGGGEGDVSRSSVKR